MNDELLLLSLNVTEMRVLLALRHLADKNGKVTATMEELGILTNYGRESVRLAVRGLENAGLVDTHRTKRNLGRLYKNEYQILPKNLASESPEILASTAGTSNIKLTTSNTLIKNTSYSLAGEARYKEVPVVNRWKDDDDDIAGVGLLESDVAAKAKPKKVSKSRPVNRVLRPESDWTPQDVATEFSMMLYQHCKAHTGPVDSNKLRAIIAGNRNRYKLTADVELKVMRQMFADESAVAAVRKAPENGYKVFLTWIMNYVNQTAKGTVDIEKKSVAEFVYASDGTEFDNSMPGRKALAQYEAELTLK